MEQQRGGGGQAKPPRFSKKGPVIVDFVTRIQNGVDLHLLNCSAKNLLAALPSYERERLVKVYHLHESKQKSTFNSFWCYARERLKKKTSPAALALSANLAAEAVAAAAEQTGAEKAAAEQAAAEQSVEAATRANNPVTAGLSGYVVDEALAEARRRQKKVNNHSKEGNVSLVQPFGKTTATTSAQGLVERKDSSPVRGTNSMSAESKKRSAVSPFVVLDLTGETATVLPQPKHLQSTTSSKINSKENNQNEISSYNSSNKLPKLNHPTTDAQEHKNNAPKPQASAPTLLNPQQRWASLEDTMEMERLWEEFS